MLPQNRAYYRPLTDEIVMPMAEQFYGGGLVVHAVA